MNAIMILVIIFFLVVFLGGMWPPLGKCLWEMLFRGLSGLIILYICNLFLVRLGENFVVNINEISLTISAFLGIPGIFFLYCFRWYLTILS
ncbi:MAG: pro-sigmaK processing inhibitor BofA family protein [Lachnospiraceae bacterium]|nr:pro-sigmaK processing inhibitor BofA family protein [Lachnospiraceae bacterium]